MIKGEIEDIDFRDRRFDVITIFRVLEHIPNPSLVMEKFYNVLTEEGVLIIAVPNEIDSFIRHPIKRLLSILRITKYGKSGLSRIELDDSLDEVHLSHFTVKTLKKQLNKKKFIVNGDTLDPYYVATRVKKIIYNFLYFILLIIKRVFKINLYNTIWIVAKCK